MSHSVTTTITRLTNPCDRCGMDGLGNGISVATIHVMLKSGPLELCGSHFAQNEIALTAQAVTIEAIETPKP